MFKVLNNCFKKYSQVTSSSSGPNLSGNIKNNSMQKSHPKRADNIDACVFPDLESFGYMTLTDATKQARISPPNKDKIVAELFKEVADDEANDFPAAKVRYGDCLYHGKGVDQKFSEALKYFEKAAEDDFKVAMYNAGSMYYDGFGCTKDIEKTKYYMKLATYNNYEAAIKFCKEHNL
ncbi:unnamed protein product [Rhizophagus irregularis]|uniref:HCP-like protein n=1 Tax=Rhizophagus irregularis TaxID=588596 RepID=A0A915YRK3_9GLOM|nr:unnamed protein product [Rhizophagus irregularis]CAB5320822.1 unnamed protein product [Rhizophagus irregularis]